VSMSGDRSTADANNTAPVDILGRISLSFGSAGWVNCRSVVPISSSCLMEEEKQAEGACFFPVERPCRASFSCTEGLALSARAHFHCASIYLLCVTKTKQ
jgi:hypothetical protein